MAYCTDAQKRAYKKYIANTDEIRFRVSKERKEQVSAHAKACGETIRQFMDRIIDEAIKTDQVRN